MERYCKKVNQHLLEYKVTTGLPEQIILQPAQHYIARDGENSYCLGRKHLLEKDDGRLLTLVTVHILTPSQESKNTKKVVPEYI